MNPAARGASVVALAVTLAGNPAQGDEFDSGEFVVHYTALATMQLAPKVAEAYGIVRSPHRGLLNVAVLRAQAGTPGIPVAAAVTVFAVNSEGLLKPITMRRIDEPPSVYSIGELTVAEAEAEVVRFEITVTPHGASAPIRLRLQHQFFAR